MTRPSIVCIGPVRRATLVEFLRRLLERQAIRRMESGTLSPEETEKIGQALMKLEETVQQIAKHFGLRPDELKRIRWLLDEASKGQKGGS